AITYQEFLPSFLGDRAPHPEGHYSSEVNPGIAIVFSTAAYRLGHTLLSPVIQRLNEDGTSVPGGPIGLRDAFFSATPPMLASLGIEPFLRGVAAQASQDLDMKVIDDVRNFLFGKPGMGGLDLTALNVQRGRDLGLPDFNTVRADYGLKRVKSFAEITK